MLNSKGESNKKLGFSKIKLGALKRSKSSPLNGLKRVKIDTFNDEEDEENGSQAIKPLEIPQLDTTHTNLDLLLTQMETNEPKKRPNGEILNFNNDDGNSFDDKNDLSDLLKPQIERGIPKHQPATYEIFKSLYQEHPMISSLNDLEVSELRKADMISIIGPRKFKPILTWNHLGLPKQIQNGLESMHFAEPTPIQCQSLPYIMNGEDFIGIAKTGSGKTLAFLLPLFRHLLVNPLQKSGEFIGSTPRAIILTPTRELAIQISKAAQLFCDLMKLRLCCCYGGQPISTQIAELRHNSGVDIVIGTPGRIIDLLCSNQGKILKLTNVSYLVIDEADRMFDLGFEPQIVKILQNASIRPDCQKVLFSATFPKRVEFSVRKLLKNSIVCKVGERNKVSEDVRQIIEVIGETGQSKFEIENLKVNSLLQILGKWNANVYLQDPELKSHKCLIFTERQDSADKLVKKLLSRGYVSMALHGGKDQGERDGVIKDFTNGIITILVATSIAARGLDVEGLDLVVNFDSPNHIEDYIHRIGRTGRAGNKGTAITLLSIEEERYAWDLNYIINQSKCNEADIDHKLKTMADKWGSEHKLDKPKSSMGFGGHGLEKLQAIRDDLAKAEKGIYLEDEKNTTGTEPEKGKETPQPDPVKVNYITNGEGKVGARLFEAHMTINDLPQTARWAVSKGDFLAQIEDQCNVSIVVRGAFISDPKAKGERLYLKIESDIQSDVARAVAQLQRCVLDSLQSTTS